MCDGHLVALGRAAFQHLVGRGDDATATYAVQPRLGHAHKSNRSERSKQSTLRDMWFHCTCSQQASKKLAQVVHVAFADTCLTTGTTAENPVIFRGQRQLNCVPITLADQAAFQRVSPVG